MRIHNIKAILISAVQVASLLLLGTATTFAQQTINLTAGPTSVTLPDGSVVPMWGYTCGTAVVGSSANCAKLNPAATGWSPIVITVPTNATQRSTGCSNPTSVTAGQPNGLTINCGATGSTPPSGTIANSPSGEAGYAFMWHSHNEREITTNNIFPGGMLMMMLVDSREFVIDESN